MVVMLLDATNIMAEMLLQRRCEKYNNKNAIKKGMW